MVEIKKFAPVKIIVHHPKTDKGKKMLSQKVSEIHSNFLINQIQKSGLSEENKCYVLESGIKELIDSVRDNGNADTDVLKHTK